MLKRTAFLTLLAALALPGLAAGSTTVSYDGSKTTIAGDGEDDDVTVVLTSGSGAPVGTGGLRITNPAGIVPGPGCVPETSGGVTCPIGEDGVLANLGEGGDRFRFGDSDFVELTTIVNGQGGGDALTGTYSGALDGGAGDDTLRTTGYGSQRVTGGAGADTVELTGYESTVTVGGAETDYGTRVDGDVERLRGGSGNDSFTMGSGAGTGHTIEGGGGYDTVSYLFAAGPVRATIGGSGTDAIGADVEALTGGPGDDELNGSSAGNILLGAGGNDRLSAGDGTDRLSGGEGDDTLDAGAGDDSLDGVTGNDSLQGGAGEDTLTGGSGGDVLRGGSEKDTVSYTEDPYGDEYYYPEGTPPPEREGSADGQPRPQPGVTITLDAVANDGTTGEGDDVGPDIEQIFGTYGDDTITGGPGDDEIVAYGGTDRLDGGDGADKVDAGLGDDVVFGGPGKDELRGGGDDDQLDGGPGEDLVIGQDAEYGTVDGIDLIELRDGERDAAACPAGLSRVLADQHDVVDQKCSLIERFTIGSGGPEQQPPPPPVGPSPLLRVHLKGTVVDRRGIARLRVTCAPAPVPCAGRLMLFTLHKRKLARLGRTDFAVPAGRTRIVRVKLGKLGKRLVRTRRSVRTQVFVAHQDPAAKPIRVATLKLRRARR